MTVISGYLDKNNTVYMGCDSQVSAGFGYKSKLDPTINTKIKAFDKMMVGISGSVKSCQLLLKYFELAYNDFKKEIINDTFYDFYIQKGVALDIEHSLDKFGVKCGSGKKNIENFEIILIWKDEIYKIASDLCIISINNNYFSVGNGCDFALGTLYSLNYIKKIISPIDKILLSLKSAKEHVNGVDAPFIIMNNKGLFKVYEEKGEYFEDVYSTKTKRTKEKS